MKRLFLFYLCSLTVLFSNAQLFRVDGVPYKILSEENKTVALCYEEGVNYDSELIIPETVSYNSVSYTVTSIGDSAFLNNASITSIKIPSSVMKIGNCVFSGCVSLKNISIEDGDSTLNLGGNGISGYYSPVTGLDTQCTKGLFSDCPVEELYVGRKLQYPNYEGWDVYPVGQTSPFYERKKLVKVTLGKSVTEIDDNLFNNCTSLKEVIMQGDVTVIGKRAFCNCVITYLDLPDNLVEIRDYAFLGNKLESVGIPTSVKTIGRNAFSNLYELKKLKVCNKPETYADDAFNGCYNVEEIEYAEGTTNAWVIQPNANDITSAVNVILPSTIDTISDFAFRSFKKLTSVGLPNEVKYIGSGAFSGAPLTGNMILPANTEFVGDNAFDAAELDTLVISPVLSTIGTSAFGEVSVVKIRSANPPSLGEKNFKESTIVVVPSYTEYSLYAKDKAWGRFNLESESTDGTLEITVKTAGTLASRIGLKGVELKDVYALKVIGSINDADWNVISSQMVNMRHLDLSESQTSIPWGQFKSRKLQTLVFPDNLTTIGDNTFSESDIKKAATKEYFDKIPDGTIVIPATVTQVRSHAFYSTNNVKNVIIEPGCTTVWEYAFYLPWNHLTVVDMPETVKSIGKNAFCRVDTLKLHNSDPSSINLNYSAMYSERGFQYYYETFLMVPLYSSTAFLNHDYWKRFAGVKECFGKISVSKIGKGEVVVNGYKLANATESVETILGDSIVVTFTPDSKYILSEVLLDNENVTESVVDNKLVIEEVDDNYELKVTFVYDNSDAIDDIAEDDKLTEEDVCYDLTGRIVTDNNFKGIRLSKGRKVLLK